MLPSHILEIDVAIFIFFFLIITIVGINYRGMSNTFREYAVGDKTIPTYVLVFTIMATWLSGSMFFLVLEGTYTHGWYFILAALIGIPGGLFLTGKIFGPRMSKFSSHFSASDILGSAYGKKLQAIFAACFVFTEIGFVSMQFKVIARAIDTILHCDPIWAASISAIIVIIYSAHGGVKSVTFIDVVQFMTFCIFMPILIIIMISNLKSEASIGESLSRGENFNLSSIYDPSKILYTVVLAFYLLLEPMIGSGIFQRLLMARDTKQIQDSTKMSSLLVFIVVLLIVLIGILVFVENPNLDPSKLVDYLSNRYPYEGLKGLFAVGIIALAMSAADSTLNACAVMVSHDILPSIGTGKDNRIQRSKYASYVIGLVALVVAMKVHNLLDLLLFTANFSLPILLVPLASLILGFTTSKRVVYCSIIVGAIVTVWSVIYIGGVGAFIPGIIANAVVFFGLHYFLNKKNS